MVTIVCYYHWRYSSWSYQLTYHLAMVLDFSLEKAAGSIIPAHSISGIFNEIPYFSGGFFLAYSGCIYIFIGLNTMKRDGWMVQLMVQFLQYIFQCEKELSANTCLLWTVMYCTGKKYFLLFMSWFDLGQHRLSTEVHCFTYLFPGMWSCPASWVQGQYWKYKNTKGGFLWTQYHLLQPLQLLATAPSSLGKALRQSHGLSGSLLSCLECWQLKCGRF